LESIRDLPHMEKYHFQNTDRFLRNRPIVGFFLGISG
jgi:hypothetical protein